MQNKTASWRRFLPPIKDIYRYEFRHSPILYTDNTIVTHCVDVDTFNVVFYTFSAHFFHKYLCIQCGDLCIQDYSIFYTRMNE